MRFSRQTYMHINKCKQVKMCRKANIFEQRDCFWAADSSLRWLLGFISAKIVIKLSWSGSPLKELVLNFLGYTWGTDAISKSGAGRNFPKVPGDSDD